MNPLLAILLVHDHFFAKRGIASPVNHPLRQTIDRHKARLQSEFTKARLRRRVATIEQLKTHLLVEKGHVGRVQPRWARVNTIKSSTSEVVDKYFSQYERVSTLEEVTSAPRTTKIVHQDKHTPNLLAFSPEEDLTRTQAYLNGDLILQDKASCFPAHLLVGGLTKDKIGDAIDGCAAPGNKTTHLAAIMSEIGCGGRILACERDPIRSITLQKMIQKAGADKIVDVLQRQDFLALDPSDDRFANVTHLLLDPSCSGSGIMRREDIPKLALPKDPRAKNSAGAVQPSAHTSKKRKRGPPQTRTTEISEPIETDAESEAQPIAIDQNRLQKLSNLQSLIVEHALSFPAARRITYSTCSIHIEENEAVVERILKSKAATSRGWRVLKRSEQVEGMKEWKHRGIKEHPDKDVSGRVGHSLSDEEVEACIRCSPDDGEGTMGFFVCGFVRDSDENMTIVEENMNKKNGSVEAATEEEWDGFSDA